MNESLPMPRIRERADRRAMRAAAAPTRERRTRPTSRRLRRRPADVRGRARAESPQATELTAWTSVTRRRRPRSRLAAARGTPHDSAPTAAEAPPRAARGAGSRQPAPLSAAAGSGSDDQAALEPPCRPSRAGRARHRRASGQSRHARCGRAERGAPISEGVPHRSARDRERTSLLWKMVLNGIILPLRSRRKSPRLPENLEQRKERVAVQDHHALAGGKARRHPRAARQARHRRLGDALRQPSIASRLEALVARGCDRILVMPLYPQYAAATTATVVRRGVPIHDGTAPAAGAAHAARPTTRIRITSRCWPPRSRPRSRRCRSSPM